MRAFTRRPASLLLILALILGLPAAARQAPRPATNDFLVRGSASCMDDLVRRNGVQVIRALVASPDALGNNVYLVRAPQGMTADAVIQDASLAPDPDVAGIEPALLAALPETYQGLRLEQRTRAILGAVVQASRLVPPGAAIDSYWLGPVADRQIANGKTAQLTFTFQNPPSQNPADYSLSLGFAEGTSPAAAVRQILAVHGGDVSFQVANGSGQLVTLSRIALRWPAANGRITGVRLAGRDLIDTVVEVPFGTNPDGTARLVWRAYVQQPAAAVLRVDEATRSVRGAGAVVAVIDSGVDPDHPLLRNALLPGYDFTRSQSGASEWNDVLDQRTRAILGQRTRAILGADQVTALNASTLAVLESTQTGQLDPAAVPPAFGHGTMVAGVIHRVAPEAKILPLKAFDGSGSGQVADVIRAIYYAVDQGVTAINMSFSVEDFSPELMRALNYAADHGVACIASAGNDGLQVLVYPAALGNILGVASTTADDHLSLFSNYGRDLVTIAAPGEDIVTSYPGGGWALASGTSFSAPWISGITAVFASQGNGNGEQEGEHKRENKGDGQPVTTDFYRASASLSHAVPVVGSPDGAAGFGRADFAQAMQNMAGGLHYDLPARADYSIALTFAGGCVATYPPPPADSGCAVQPRTQLGFTDRTVTWQITNTGSAAILLDHLDLQWPTGNGSFKSLRWNDRKIDKRAPAPALQLRFDPGSGPRLDPGQTIVLSFEFDSTPLTS
ncbi:MAG: S8 family serine peptidase [Acidobacteria bacterium]|nr:S8 family serine peptidase [Acidobacteriota bacterium]